MREISKNNRFATGLQSPGFTLVELMVSVVASSVLVVGAASYVSSVLQTAADQSSGFQFRSEVDTALELLRADVEKAGTGIPDDLLAASPLQMFSLDNEITYIASNSIRDVNSTSASDELHLGGAGMDQSETSAKSGLIVAADLAAGVVTGTRADLPGSGYNYYATAPSIADPVPPSQFGGQQIYHLSVLNPGFGWRSAAPVPIQDIADNPPGALDLFVNSGSFTSEPMTGDQFFYLRPVRLADGTLDSPGHLQVARWFWQAGAGGQPGQLVRQLTADPDNPPAAGDANIQVVLDQVVDFQVAFLVWTCGSPNPVWIDHLLDHNAGTGHFSSASCYNPGSNAPSVADRVMAMRERLMAIRVSMLLREELPRATSAADSVFQQGTPGQVILEDRTLSGLDTDYRYFHVRRVFDPVNLRIKTPMVATETFPPVRDVFTDNAMRTPSGFWSGRRSS